ncbi:hypothetical protein EC973_002591 [Apophysomyces ossiformis]|uniref:Ubiquitin-protein ligase E3A N-terminal zinc-binding domain-containing protein n=1 Tax=Apophysomyces ossiformis TaxID=679940 RepID=A0A8H7BI60_9FUNG|nr:hypothetical protein EC973_002591 [Apophysomyces ossiformis]
MWTKSFLVEATPTLNSGDKIILPAAALEELLQTEQQHQSPWTFELRHPHTKAILHGGVKEFSGLGETTVQIPPWMLDSMDLKDGQHIVIQRKDLPKGTWTKLRPLSQNYNEITDYRAALESQLRTHYNTLTSGQMLTCRYGSRDYSFLVVDLKPAAAVCITDTDLEVDIEPFQTTEQQPTLKADMVHMDQVISANILKDQYQYWPLVIHSSSTPNLTIQLTVETGDADIVVGTNRSPTLEDHAWSSLTSEPERRLTLSQLPSNVDTLYVGIHGYTDTKIAWIAHTASALENEPTVSAPLPAADTDLVQCNNCHAWLPERTRVLHEGFCLRNNVVCPQGCGQVFKKDSKELAEHWHCDMCNKAGSIHEKPKHYEYFHQTKTCSCQDYITTSYDQLAEHRRTECPEHLIICRFCHNLVPQGKAATDPRDRLLGLHDHESYCGSRTITCQKCKRQIPIKEIQVHAKIHEVARQNQKLPPLCSNQNCIRARAKNRLGLCQYCFGPFWVTEDDPKNVKLIQRIARRLHQQLTIGCGNTWCRNKHCATGTGNSLDATTAASELIPMIQALPRQLNQPDPNPELYLCVDEKTTRQRTLAETMRTVYTENHFDLDWCIKALESEDNDLERAKYWLEANAPKRT